ncbi:hypothetical protein OBBRIDRAFT_890127, partial [Obba rivulosa]
MSSRYNPYNAMQGVPIKRSAISKPRTTTETRSIQRAMGISLQAFKRFSEYMRKSLKRYCDTTRGYEAQDSQQLKRFRREALEVCPMLEHYEDRWPLEIWTKKQLYMSAYRYRQKRRNLRKKSASISHGSFADAVEHLPSTTSPVTPRRRNPRKNRLDSLTSSPDTQPATPTYSTQSPRRSPRKSRPVRPYV